MRLDDAREGRPARSVRFAATVLLIALTALVVGGSVVSCFSPREPPCAFSCARPPHACPPDYTCGNDGYCHRVDATAACDYGDAGREAASGSDATAENDAAAD